MWKSPDKHVPPPLANGVFRFTWEVGHFEMPVGIIWAAPWSWNWLNRLIDNEISLKTLFSFITTLIVDIEPSFTLLLCHHSFLDTVAAKVVVMSQQQLDEAPPSCLSCFSVHLSVRPLTFSLSPTLVWLDTCWVISDDLLSLTRQSGGHAEGTRPTHTHT